MQILVVVSFKLLTSLKLNYETLIFNLDCCTDKEFKFLL